MGIASKTLSKPATPRNIMRQRCMACLREEEHQPQEDISRQCSPKNPIQDVHAVKNLTRTGLNTCYEDVRHPHHPKSDILLFPPPPKCPSNYICSILSHDGLTSFPLLCHTNDTSRRFEIFTVPVHVRLMVVIDLVLYCTALHCTALTIQ
jgi:hypothetical protein